MRNGIYAASAALGATLVLSAPALAGVDGPPGSELGNSNAQPGQQNCLGKVLSNFAEGEGLHIGQEAEGEGGANLILPLIASVRDSAAIEGECGGGNIP